MKTAQKEKLNEFFNITQYISEDVNGTSKPPQHANIEFAIRDLLTNIGENPDREGLQKTPNRVARMYDELTSGYNIDAEALINGALFSVEYDEMVLVKNIELHSMCEHHMLPFHGSAHVAYIPDGKVIGLSKIPRIVDMFARRLQVQERLTVQIADFIDDVLKPKGVAVVIEGTHMCMVMRGVKKENASMTTTAVRGEFKTNEKTRAEFMGMIN